ncbi:hypothetical protein AYK26_05440 [Euryarchaeota archaeon SM23-78]|nr:MAG: hypothetical protein AYK26_05440 [Euryarchaeota archaeon SM23-78]MBW3001045.1 hypothetical protein [Candidatus Woesearchaeota archaeon]
MTEDIKEPKSELELLLEKNACGVGLTPEERLRAHDLITKRPEYSKEDCWLCKQVRIDKVEKSIYDTRLCQYHAYAALISRK